MKDFFINVFKLLIALIILLYGEVYSLKIFEYLNLDFDKYSSLVKDFIYFVIYLIEFIIIYFLYKKEIHESFLRFRRKFSSNVIQSLIKFIMLFIIIVVVNYLCVVIGKSFYLNYNEIEYLTIFNRTFNFNLILVFLKLIVFIPIIKVIIFSLGVSKIISNQKLTILISGILYASYIGYFMSGSITNILINIVPVLILFMFLTHNYLKSNIIISSMIIYVLYEFLGEFLISLW